MTQGSSQKQFDPSLEADRYLIFRLGHELYGTPLLGVREVVENQPAKSVPNTVPHFKGVINIRGQIVGVIDLRMRFDHPAAETPNTALMVFETNSGPMAALVDKVESVVKIEEQYIVRRPNVRSMRSLEFLIGIAQDDGRLVTLVDLNKTLGNEELKALALGDAL
jgi:purine-binding chemotaxis protein CheW